MHNLTFFSFSFFSSRFFFLLGLSGSDFHVFMFSPLSLVKADPVNKLELHYLVHRDSGGKFGAFNGGGRFLRSRCFCFCFFLSLDSLC